MAPIVIDECAMAFNIRNKLILFAVLAIILPLGIAALIILFQLTRFTHERARERIQSDARVAQAIFTKRQEKLRASAQSIAQTLAGRGFVRAGADVPPESRARASSAAATPVPTPFRIFQEVLETARKASHVDFVALLDQQGTVLVQHNGPAAGDGLYLKDNTLFIDVSNQPGDGPQSSPRVEETPVVEAMGLQARATANGLQKALFLEAAAPVTTSDGVQGIVLLGQLVNNDVSADAHGRQSIVNEIEETLYPTLREDAAAVVALDKTIVSTNLSGGAREAVVIGKTIEDGGGSIEEPSVNTQSFGDHEYITSFVPINEASKAAGTRQLGRVGVAIRESWFTAIVSRVRWTILAVMLGALALAIVGAVYAAHRLTLPIIQLTEAANRISRAELDDPINISTDDEIGTLGEALDRMRISVKQAIGRLRKR
jgi:HAMP domain-containing protein